MTAELGPFEAFYASPLQHPVLLWLAATLALAYVATRRDLHTSLRHYGLALAGLSLCDAWLTSSPVPGVGTLSDGAASAVALFFVLAGDFRFLLLLEAGTPDGRLVPTGRALLRAGALTLLVPIGSQLVHGALGGGPRQLFLIYEVSFFVLAALLAARHPGPRSAAWLRRVSGFVMLYYALWAAADTFILYSASDWGFALRVLPNVLYYGGLVAAIAAFAPRTTSQEES